LPRAGHDSMMSANPLWRFRRKHWRPGDRLSKESRSTLFGANEHVPAWYRRRQYRGWDSAKCCHGIGRVLWIDRRNVVHESHCESCEGTGHRRLARLKEKTGSISCPACRKCSGTGNISVFRKEIPRLYFGHWESEKCINCNGTGFRDGISRVPAPVGPFIPRVYDPRPSGSSSSGGSQPMP
jgi:hypothetical protein